METRQTAIFKKWLDGLRDDRAVRSIRIRIVRIESGNMGDVRSVGSGVSEVRINHGPGYRLYFTKRDGRILILLCGGDKASQARDIERAKNLAAMIP